MGLISRLGKWLDTRFPEKISADEVYRSLTAYEGLRSSMLMQDQRIAQLLQKQDAFTNGAQAFEKELREVKDELNKVKAVQVMTKRTLASPVLPTSEAWKR